MEIGVNVMSSSQVMREDFAGSIRKLKESGCSYLEAMSDWGAKPETIQFYADLSGGPSGWDPDQTVERIAEARKIGMDIKGIFVFEECIEEQLDKLGPYCRENGISYLVFTFPEYKDLDDIYDKIGLIRRIAACMNPFGIQILIHNHSHDTNPVIDRDGLEKPILNVFLEQCSEEELMLEIDTGWLVHSGIDAPAYIREHLDRIAVLHLKDIAAGCQQMENSGIHRPCGQGIVDFPAILKVSAEKKDMMYVLDQDASSGSILDDHAASIRYISQISSGLSAGSGQ